MAIEREWVGCRVSYYTFDALNRIPTFYGPFDGTVTGVTTNESLIEDRLEGLTHRNAISFTGELIIKPDDGAEEEFAFLSRCEKIKHYEE